MLSPITGCTKKDESKEKEIQKTEEDTPFMRLKKAKERNDKKEIEAIMQETNEAPTNSINVKQDKNKANVGKNNNNNIGENDNSIPLQGSPEPFVIENKQNIKKNEITDKKNNKEHDYGSIVVKKDGKVIEVIEASSPNVINE